MEAEADSDGRGVPVGAGKTRPPGDVLGLPPHLLTTIDSTEAPGQYGEAQTQDGVEFVILNDDVLNSVANATVALMNGHSLERMAVLYQFPQFLEHCPHDAVHLMVPRICTTIMEEAPDVQMAAAEALYFVSNMRIPDHIAKHVVVATLSVIAVASEGEVFDACGEILSMVLPQVHRNDVLHLVVPAMRERADSNSPESRRLAARIIGSVNDSLTPPEMEQLFFHHALVLADDSDDTVRVMMTQSLAAVGTKLPLHLAESKVWPTLHRLINDPNVRVRAAAMRALAKSAEAHREHASTCPTFRNVLKPFFLAECQRAASVASQDLRVVDDDTYLMLEIFAEVFGHLLYSLYTLFDEKDRIWVAVHDALRAMSSSNGPTVRHWCAFNMPATATVLAKRDSGAVVNIVLALASDNDVETRATLAAGIKETASLLCRGQHRGEIIQAVSTLFMDENAQVRMNALGHLSELLSLLSPGEEANLATVKKALQAEFKKTPSSLKSSLSGTVTGSKTETEIADSEMRRLSQIFSSLEMMPFDSWRSQEMLAEQLRKSAHLVPQQMLCENVAPLLFQMARESTYLVRKASMRALMSVLRYIPDVRRRTHILRHFRQEWARGQVYWTRLAFVDGAEFALEILSTKLFNQLFKKELLRLSHDDVPNVKTRLLRLFSQMVKRWGASPEFLEALERLSRDKDQQVADEAASMLRRLASIPAVIDFGSKEEREREEREDAFFVHRAKRKKGASKGIVSEKTPGKSLQAPAPADDKGGFSIIDDSSYAYPVEEHKGVPPAQPAGGDAKGRMPTQQDMGLPTSPQATGKPPGLFQRLFGACLGG